MEVKTIAVIGAGVTGRDVARAAAIGGYFVVLEDVSGSMLAKALAWIREALEEEVQCGNLDDLAVAAALARISTSQVVDKAIRDAELIIETVPDELEMKLELFTIFDKFAKPNAIFASTASSLSIRDFSDIVVYRERCIGMRFFQGTRKRDLVEIVRTPFASEETVAACAGVVARMGMQAVLVEEGPAKGSGK